MPRSYPPEFHRKVLDLVKAGRPVRQVAEDLHMPSQTIYVWLRQDRIDSGAGTRTDLGRPGRTGRRPAPHRPSGDRARRHPAGRRAGKRGGAPKGASRPSR
ncbi:transposase [Actinomadura adrarensis]|uniref:Transposase n=1 Tax=Actinomadura adrarensis TaxID=1819600 RepID=A0ABW3CN76_9ACTN